MKHKIIYSLAIALIGSLFIVGDAFAASMRCGTHIVSDSQRNGMGKYEVLKRCGEPTERFGNTWVYDRPGQFKRTLRFAPDGRLSKIEG
ncbi:MAG: DUF2845 domain-containing protein [Gammaproteobacteria bacterium]